MAENNLGIKSEENPLEEIMRSEARGFSTAKATLRFYLSERKRIIGEGQEIDWSTAQGVWYLVEPYIPKKASGENLNRKVFVSYIRQICKNELNCRREDLRIVAGGRAELYFNGGWTSISWDSIEELSESGTDGILIEKEGMSKIFEDFVNPRGFAIINSRGFFVDYLDDVSTKSIDKKSNLVLIRDFDPSGLVIEMGAKQLGIPCIGVNDEMLKFLKLTRENVQDRHPPSDKNPHWIKVKDTAKTNPDVAKEINFLSKYRIEIDKVHAKVGSKRLFEYVLHVLKKYHRDLNRVAFPNDYVQPRALGRLAYEMERIGKEAAKTEHYNIWEEQTDYKGICKDIEKRQAENDDRIRDEVEADKNIIWATNQILPVITKLEEVETGDEDDGNE